VNQSRAPKCIQTPIAANDEAATSDWDTASSVSTGAVDRAVLPRQLRLVIRTDPGLRDCRLHFVRCVEMEEI
jgi:hypothetical protein